MTKEALWHAIESGDTSVRDVMMMQIWLVKSRPGFLLKVSWPGLVGWLYEKCAFHSRKISMYSSIGPFGGNDIHDCVKRKTV